jgi:hypothetical protein
MPSVRVVGASALLAALTGAAAASLVALFLPPVRASYDPALVPDPRPVVLPGGTYTPFTARPTRPPHPLSVYRPPTEAPSSNSRTR